MSNKQIKRVKNGISYEMNGWIYVSIRGGARERGYAYGKLVAYEMKDIQTNLRFTTYFDLGVKWDFFIEAAAKHFKPKIMEKFPEFYEEMVGFSEGCTAAGTDMSIDEVVAWNNWFTLTGSWFFNMPEEERIAVKGNAAANVMSKEGGATDRCSAFIATGDWTADGKIVVAHNNFSNFVDGQFARVVLDLKPDKGARMIIQGFAGWIWSGTDFFVTSNGIIGTETTIGGFFPYENNIPISCRIRNAMQYGKNMDDYVEMLLDVNSGDYANSWLFGDTKTNEILRLELGLRFHNVERTKNGYFIGFNAPYDPRIRNLECVNTGFDDIRRHQGARRVRLEELMDKWKGKLNIELAQQILADHYDIYLHKENPCSRTVCSHYEMDAREYMSDPTRPKPYQPRGALDGNVCDTTMAKAMSFCLRWGDSCGIPFDKNKFCDEHMEWNYLREYLRDRPQQPWTTFTITNNYSKNATSGKRAKGTYNVKTRRRRQPKIDITN
jgi:hypothetical protein